MFQRVSKHATTKDDNRDQKGPVSLNNEAICIVGIK